MQPDWRAQRALRVLHQMDQAGTPLCPSCEGLVLAACAGRPLPLVVCEDGRIELGESHVDALLARLESRLARRVPA